ncbi:lipoprotein [Alcanivorax sp. JB21]|uniref:LPS translocon maturation chaperone LptM n=1 Tax=Alcanivorax limicola TaxID=2874102 RepID=UPI001CBC7D9F|nr:lipoprotein [Alcanivorax limicola]MBZ2189199.1 lipoprotein [Alcanivorax limicola]
MRYCAIMLLVLMLSACGQRGALYFPGETGNATSQPAPSTPTDADSDVSDSEDNDD